jgi:MHS family proline/betaine transporter-like MFS transporter
VRLCGVCIGITFGAFPTAVGSTGTAFAHSLAVTIFGSFTPAIISGLANYTGSNLSVVLRLIFSTILSSVSLLAVQDRSRMELL